ncbi:helix-turn-helix domain-containing protein [Clostridium cadaveris]|nr:helix-turn-helix domain-containing protein [Clostridium cadaveris]
MKNRKMVPFEVVEKAITGEQKAINAVLYHYRGYIKY